MGRGSMTHHKVILSAAFYIAGLYLYGDLISDFQERMGVILLLGSTPPHYCNCPNS